MCIKSSLRQYFFISMAVILGISVTGCRNRNAELVSFSERSISSPVQTMSVQDMDRAETYAEKLCVIPEKEVEEDDAFSSSAQLCINITDQKAVYANHIYDRLYPASVTKLFSAYVILKYGNLEDMVTVSKTAAGITEAGAKLCGMKEGEQYSLRSLLEIMLVYSANDAALLAAEHVGGSAEKFVKMMNREAVRIGAADSHFVNPHGLHDENHYTTAYDIYLVLNELIKNEIFIEIVNKDECEIPFLDTEGVEKSMKCTSTNQFLLGTQPSPEGMTIIGGKTGTTFAAGSCLSMYGRAEDGKEYIAVILKAANTGEVFAQMSQLLSMCIEDKEK